MIGALGSVVFIASADTIRTLQDFTRSTAGRWATHEVIGQKPLLQFVGPGLDTVTFTMRFDVAHGLNPRKEMDALIELERNGEAVSLTLGGKGIGTGLWVITSQEQTYNVIDNKGNVLVGTASISLQEYVVRAT